MSVEELARAAQFIAQEEGLTDREPGGLYSGELFWRDLQPLLKEKGYTLRPRYDPAWKPSWKGTKKLQSACEDSLYLEYTHIIDAVRDSDGAFVVLKRLYVSNHPDEIKISQSFSTPELRAEPDNHCVPVLDVFQVPSSKNEAVMAMPMMRKFDDPPFETVGETVDFFNQVLRGLRFMHAHFVAHGDCNANNIMLDPSDLYPDSYHPVATDMNRSYTGRAKYLTRTQKPPKYYFIDFGNARRYPSGTDLKAPQDPLPRSGDKSVPEYQTKAPYSPFAADVYLIGNVIRQRFLEKKRGFGFMSELVGRMVDPTPAKRPTMETVVADFDEICKSLSTAQLGSRVVDRDQSFVFRLIDSIIYYGKRMFGRDTGVNS